MKYFGSLLLLFVLLSANFAQDSCKAECAELKHGLQFQVRTLSLANYNGYTLAYRYLLNKDSGLRIGFYASINDEDAESTQLFDSVKYDVPYNRIDNNLKLSVQYLTTLLRKKRFFTYCRRRFIHIIS